MKIQFNFTLDEFQAETLLSCIQHEIVNITSSKLDYIGSPAHVKHLDSLIEYHKNLIKIITDGQNRIP